MGLGPFGLISLLYVVLGVRVVIQLIRSWRTTFDTTFTDADRALVNQAAFFVLVPISVALHEFGHAVAIWLMGGDVLGWGYYGFAGFVAFNPQQFSEPQRILIAAAGTIVNIVLAALALWLVFGRRPPMRAAYNELLIQFVVISLLNALIAYPLLDFATGLNGDWTQMYAGGEPVLSALILVIHVGILAAMFWAWKNPGVRARIDVLTGRRPGMRRVAPARNGDGRPRTVATPTERLLTEAAQRVTDGWPQRVQAGVQATPDGAVLALSWEREGAQRAVLARIAGNALDVSGVAAFDPAHPQRRMLGRFAPLPDADALTLHLRLAMETVDDWQPAPTMFAPRP